ncbi:MAG: glycosyltransferase family 2 protein [Solobacterium sp.]|nr:glycosyltransferase family 2 protein [Solobacterium sp.]
MPTVSVIIPAYNAARTILRCVNSVLEQSFKDVECIVIDDGSSDNTAEILGSIGDERLRYIYKENGGVSSSRNRGLDEAKGEYICFMDADDYQSDQALSQLVSAMRMNDVDLVVAGFYRVVDDKLAAKSYFKKECVMSRKEYASKMSKKPAEYYFGVLWNKLYKRSIIEQFNMRMDESISWSEDFIFNLEYIRHIQDIFILKSPVYYYIRTEGSLVYNNNNLVARMIKMKLDVYRHYKKFLEDVFPEEEGYWNEKFILLDAASDGGTSVMPKKLGDEKISINKKVLGKKSYLRDLYIRRKLADKFLSVVALRNNLNLSDVYVFLAIMDDLGFKSLDEYSDYLNMDKLKVRQGFVNLKKNKYIKYKEKDEDNYRSIVINDSSLKIMDEIELARHEIENLLTGDIDTDNLEIYMAVSEKIRKKEEEIV